MENMRDVLFELMGENLTSGRFLRGKRIEAELSQDELARITGISRPNISALENDRMPMTNRYAEIFSVVLNVHPADILYPNGYVRKSKEVEAIEKRAKEFAKGS